MTAGTGVKDAVRTFIVEQLEWPGPVDELTDDASLIDAGVIDSLSLIEVAHWLGERYHITINDTDLVAANFSTLEAIEGFVQRGAKS
jgi:acyl carrier protein